MKIFACAAVLIAAIFATAVHADCSGGFCSRPLARVRAARPFAEFRAARAERVSARFSASCSGVSARSASCGGEATFSAGCGGE